MFLPPRWNSRLVTSIWGFNRRKVVDGQATMWWRNADKLPSHPVDPTVSALIVKDATAKTRAVLVNYACHPSVLGPSNLEYSADYPGAMRRYVESQIPGASCLFVQGGGRRHQSLPR